MDYLDKLITEITDLNEKRSHPLTNVDPTFEQYLNKILSLGDIKDLFVSFRSQTYVTDINKNNQYNTPTGVYTYPLASYDVQPNMNESNFRGLFPYKSEEPYMVFFHLKDDNGVLNSSTPKTVLDEYVNRIQKLYSNINPVNGLCDLFLEGKYQSTYMQAKHYTHKFWLFLYDVIPYITGTNKQTKITTLCNRIGVNGFIDYNGDGFIHPSEKKQAVFFRFKGIGDIFYYKRKDTDTDKKNTDIYNFLDKLVSDNKVDKIIKIFGNNVFNNIKDKSIRNLINNADLNNKEKLVNLILKYKTILTNNNIFYILDFYLNHKMAKISEIPQIILNRIGTLDSGYIDSLFMYGERNNMNKVISLVLRYRGGILTTSDISNLIYYSKDKLKMVKYISKTMELKSLDIYYILKRFIKDDENIINVINILGDGRDIFEILGNSNANTLLKDCDDTNSSTILTDIYLKYMLPENISNSLILNMIRFSNDPDITMKIINKKKPHLSNSDINNIFQALNVKNGYNFDMDNIINYIIDNNDIDDNILNLIIDNATDKDNIIEHIIRVKKYLSDSEIQYLIHSSRNKEKTLGLIGAERLNKMESEYIIYLINYSFNPTQMEELLGKYIDLSKINLNESLINIIQEEIFRYNDLTPEEQNNLYKIFSSSYQKSVGTSWDKHKFDNRASGWLFYGDKNEGFVTLRKQNSGLYKLTGVAGSLRGISNGLEELVSQNVPVWGMMDEKLSNIMVKKYGFIAPHGWMAKMLFKTIPSSVFGGSNFSINNDGSMTLHYEDVGDAKKYFVANKSYYIYLITNILPKANNIPQIAITGLKKLIGV